MTKKSVQEYLVEMLGALLLGGTLALLIPHANAGLIGTEEAVSASQAQQDREKVRAMVERPEITSQLEKMGIAPHEAKARVAAMNDAEIHSLAGKLGVLPAGADISNTDFLLIILLILVLVILL